MSVSCECLCCQVEVSASGRSLVQRSPTEYGVSECDLGTLTMRKPRPTGAVEPREKKMIKHKIVDYVKIPKGLQVHHLEPDCRRLWTCACS